MENHRIIPTAEPFFFPGGPTGCLLVHGFTGTPKEMRLLGEHLHQQGHTVLGIRLAGHATQIEDMMRMHDHDWLADVESGWNLLQDCTERVVVIGLSMGGVLALNFAADFPVAGVVALSAPYEMPNKLAQVLGPMLVPLSVILPKLIKSSDSWFNPEAEKEHVSYAHHPTRPAWELSKLIQRMRARLPSLQAPALLIQSRQDDYLRNSDNTEMLFERIGSRDKELIWVEDTDHVITRDGDTAKVFGPVAEFVRRVTGY